MSGPLARCLSAALLSGVLCLVALPVPQAQPASAAQWARPEPVETTASAASAGSTASAGLDAASRRAALADERQRLVAGFDAEEAACARRFFVNACIDEVRQRRRAALASIDTRERALDEAVRRERAEQRRRSTLQRQQAAATAEATAAAASASRAGTTPSAAGAAPDAPVRRTSAPPRSPRTPASAGAPRQTRAPPDPAERAAEAAARAAAAERRREETRAVQERIGRRQAERAASGKVTQPLPVPVPASAAGR